jgi:hypothetical protein
MPPVICSIPQTLTVSFTDYPGLDTITIGTADTIDIDVIYTTDDSQSECVHPMNWQSQKAGSGVVAFDTVLEAAEDTTYTKTFDPSSGGTYTINASLAWSEENPPVPPITFMTSDNSLTVIVADYAEVDSRVESRTATAGVETQTADATLETKNVTARAVNRSADAAVETRTATAGVEARGVTADVETRTGTAGLETRTAISAVENRSATAGVEARAVDAELPTRTVGSGVE